MIIFVLNSSSDFCSVLLVFSFQAFEFPQALITNTINKVNNLFIFFSKIEKE